MKRCILWMLVILLSGIVSPETVSAKPKKKSGKKEIAIQLYSIRHLLRKDGKYVGNLPEALKSLAKMGYTGVEAANYKNGKFYGMTPVEFRKAVEDAGMKVLSSHTTKRLTAEELESGDYSKALKWWEQCIADHKAAGMTYIVTPSIQRKGIKNLAQLETYCRYFNAIGEMCKKAGLQYGYHNHDFEFKKIEDQVMLDYMIQHTDPNVVFFQMDVYWVVRGQASPVDYINKYPGRFKLLHIKDEREIGQSGMVGFDAIFANTKTAGVADIVVEVERYSGDVEQSIKQSIDYLLAAPFVKASYRK